MPVIEHDKLVGLITEGTMAEASPSKATSLSIYEMNYLLNKTKVGDIMIKNVLTVSNMLALRMQSISCFKIKLEFFRLWTMTKFQELSQIRCLSCFLEISGYGQAGIRIGLEVPDTPRVLEKLRTLSLVRISTSNVQLLQVT